MNIVKTYIGELWIAKDIDSGKVRPFLILSDELSGIEVDITTIPTTAGSKRNKFDIEINHWKEAGLERKSFARCSKISYINFEYLHRKIGELHKEDLANVKEALRRYLAL